MTEGLRKSGIAIFGDIPWGTNICQLYSTGEDLSEVLVPFMLAGLENNEYCIWVTSEPLTDRDAEECLRRASPHFDGYLREGRIEIISHTSCYLDNGRFNSEKAFHTWMEMIDRAFKKGLAGIRATANTSWVRQDEWKNFIGYKQDVDRIVGSLPMIAICSFSLDGCSAEGIIDMISSHQLAMAKREGSWELIENSRGRRIIDALRESEDRYRCLVESSPDGIIVHRDGKILYANPEAIRMYGAASLEQLQSGSLMDIVPPEDRPFVETRIWEVLVSNGKPPLREMTITGFDGSRIPVETTGWLILYQGEPAVQSLIRDISRKKHDQEESLERSAELEATFSAQNDVVMIFDRDMNVRQVNPSFPERYGFNPCGMSLPDMITRASCRKVDGSPVRLEDLPTCGALRGEKVVGERFIVRGADGADMVIEMSSGPMYIGDVIIGAVTVSHDVTGLTRAEEALRRSISRFGLLAETAGSLLQASEPKNAIESLCRKVMEHIDCEIFLNFLADDHEENLVLNAWAGITSKEARCIMSVDYDTTICGAAAKEASRIVAEHILDSADESTKMLRALGIRAYACQHLSGEGGKVIGTLCFATKKRNTFSEEDLSLIKAVADQMAAAMVRLRNEQELRRSENRYRNLVELSPDAVYINRAGKIVMLNPAAIKLFGAKTASQVLNRPVFDLFHPECHDVMRERHRKLKEGITILHSEEKILRLDGTTRDVDVTATPMADTEGSSFQVILHDVTERNKREQELRKLNRTLHALSESNQAMIRATDEYSFLQDACRIIVEDCGYTMAWIGYAQEDEKKWVLPVAYAGLEEGYLDNLKISWDEDSDQTRDPTGLAVRTGRPVFCADMETEPSPAPWKEEAMRRGYASALAIPVMGGGRAIGALTVYSAKPCSFTDDEAVLLTELSNDLSYGLTMLRLNAAAAHVEEALRQSEHRYSSLFNAMTEGFALHEVITDEAGNPCDYRFIDVNPSFERYTGLKHSDIIGRKLSEVLRNNEPSWVEIYGNIATKGDPVHSEYYFSPYDRYFEVFSYSPAPGQLAVVFMDVTERRRMEDEVRKHRDYLEDLVKERTTELEEEIEQRRRAQEALAASEANLRRANEVAILGSWMIDLATNEIFWSEGVYKIFGFTPGIPVSYPTFLNAVHPDDREFVDRSWKATLNRESPYDIEHRIIVNGEVKWVREKAEVDFSGDGRPLRGAGFVQDITKRIRADEEQNKLRQSLAHVSRVATVGELTSALAHEINQPLAAILANAQAARHIVGADRPDMNELKEALDDIIADDKRAREVIRRIRSMLKGRSSSVERMDINEAVQEAVKLVERESSHRDIPIKLDLDAGIPRVEGDRIQIGQIVINLVINAMEAIGDDPDCPRQITIRSRKDDDSGEVIISVQDTGKGFDAEGMNSIFEPFYTTKPHGLGLGLSISRSIIEAHGGRLFASPNKDRGATFSFSLSGCREE